jgi:hypothetical protein
MKLKNLGYYLKHIESLTHLYAEAKLTIFSISCSGSQSTTFVVFLFVRVQASTDRVTELHSIFAFWSRPCVHGPVQIQPILLVQSHSQRRSRMADHR